MDYTLVFISFCLSYILGSVIRVNGNLRKLMYTIPLTVLEASIVTFFFWLLKAFVVYMEV